MLTFPGDIFIHLFRNLLPCREEKLYLEFVNFQTMQDTDIPLNVWNDAKLCEKLDDGEVTQYHRMDTLWVT